jgi:hypothetical protein
MALLNIGYLQITFWLSGRHAVSIQRAPDAILNDFVGGSHRRQGELIDRDDRFWPEAAQT